MKKVIALSVLAIGLLSCEKEVIEHCGCTLTEYELKKEANIYKWHPKESVAIGCEKERVWKVEDALYKIECVRYRIDD